MLEQKFFDQDGELVKQLKTLKIAEMDGRQTAVQQRMGDVDAPDEWTEIQILQVEFDIDIPDSTFTQSNLRNPRER